MSNLPEGWLAPREFPYNPTPNAIHFSDEIPDKIVSEANGIVTITERDGRFIECPVEVLRLFCKEE